ncbi:type II toxin-antitoxin system HigB family toxin [Nostoc sp. FACHB-973]|nr:type II toxin-antitoxin system HigB family toxin [Nostoc sp. FACHB-973]
MPLQVYLIRPGSAIWYDRISKSSVENFAQLRQLFPSADVVKNFTVFNIGGNNYRLITYIDYQAQMIFIRAVLTHADYDKEEWKNDNWFNNS